jgi:hypothetical protein
MVCSRQYDLAIASISRRRILVEVAEIPPPVKTLEWPPKSKEKLEYSAPLVTTTWSISGYKVTGEYGATFEIDKSPTEMAP